eukprot:5682233-Pyramimonas_sp.AAC.1
MCSDDGRARKELYEVPGGNQVDGEPPVPILKGSITIETLGGTDNVPKNAGKGGRGVGYAASTSQILRSVGAVLP